MKKLIAFIIVSCFLFSCEKSDELDFTPKPAKSFWYLLVRNVNQPPLSCVVNSIQVVVAYNDLTVPEIIESSPFSNTFKIKRSSPVTVVIYYDTNVGYFSHGLVIDPPVTDNYNCNIIDFALLYSNNIYSIFQNYHIGYYDGIKYEPR